LLSQHSPASSYAYATFLSADTTAHAIEDPPPDDPEEHDGYYLATRVLAYQLLHQPNTRSNTSIPFLVLAAPGVEAAKLARLTADGATVIADVPPIAAEWIHPREPRWRDVLIKLRVAQQLSYAKVCYIDADMLLVASLDGVFEDPAATRAKTGSSLEALHDHESPLPKSYVFAGVPDAWGYDHAFPPPETSEQGLSFFNTGFFVLAPSTEIFAYYAGLVSDVANKDKLGGAEFPDQDALNYAHRRDGNMPWRRLGAQWQANWPTKRDWEAGVKSFHAKYWDGDPSHDVVLREEWERVRDEMRVFYRGWDERGGGR